MTGLGPRPLEQTPVFETWAILGILCIFETDQTLPV